MSENKNNKHDFDNGVVETFSDKINKFLKNWMIDIAIAAILLIYILKTLVDIEVTTSGIWSILGDCVLMLVFLTSIKSLMLRKGMFAGEKNAGYQRVKSRYEEKLLEVMPKSQYLSDYISTFNERERKEAITRVLASYGMSLERYEQGIENPTKVEAKALKAAKRTKYLRLSVTDLTGSGVQSVKKPGLGKTKDEFLHSKSLTDIGITIASVLIFSVFTFKLASEFSWANLIWVGMQVVVFLVKGTISFVGAYVFVTEDYTNRLVRQTNLLIEFDSLDINAFKSKKAELGRSQSERKRIEDEERARQEREAEKKAKEEAERAAYAQCMQELEELTRKVSTQYQKPTSAVDCTNEEEESEE